MGGRGGAERGIVTKTEEEGGTCMMTGGATKHLYRLFCLLAPWRTRVDANRLTARIFCCPLPRLAPLPQLGPSWNPIGPSWGHLGRFRERQGGVGPNKEPREGGDGRTTPR